MSASTALSVCTQPRHSGRHERQGPTRPQAEAASPSARVNRRRRDATRSESSVIPERTRSTPNDLIDDVSAGQQGSSGLYYDI